MSTDLIRYDLLVQNALKSVVRNVLTDAARDGLPGDHHFCITFRTHGPGVKLSSRVKQKHPEELTIILQHQFWDLVVTEHAFEVGLSFGRIPERLCVPFEAVTGFWDPSVQFGLKFEIQEEAPAGGDNDAAPVPTPALPAPRALALATSDSITLEPRSPTPEPAPPSAVGVGHPATVATNPSADRAAEPRSSETPPSDAKPPEARDGADDAEPASPSEGKVISIDAFRKKT